MTVAGPGPETGPSQPGGNRARGLSLNRDLRFILLVYVIAHGLILLNTGLYYDDWLAYGSPVIYTDNFVEAGTPFIKYYYLVVAPGGIFSYRLVAFLAHLIAGLCLLNVLRGIGQIDGSARLFLVLFFLLFPVFSARILTGGSWYAFCAALFFIGLWLVARYLDYGRPMMRIAALAALFVSFLTHSLLVFYGVVLVYIVYRRGSQWRTARGLARGAARHVDFLLLPVVFWSFKLAFLEPFGAYRSYNRVTAESVLQAFAYLDNAFLGGFVEPIIHSLRQSVAVVIASAVLAAVGAKLFTRRWGHVPAARQLDAAFLFVGFAFFALGVFPYLVVGKVPAPEDWDSRHQLLVPLGASFLVVYTVRLTVPLRAQSLAYAFLAITFAGSHAHQWVAYQRDWYKQVALIENLKRSPEILRGTRFAFVDRTTVLNANGRAYRPYEYAGLLYAAFGDSHRTAMIHHGKQPAEPPASTVVVDHGDLILSLPEVARLRWLESLDAPRFREEVRRVVRLLIES